MKNHGMVVLPILSVLIGVAVAAGLVLGANGGLPRAQSLPAGSVAFEGVQLSVTYLGGAPMIFGSVSQDACQQITPDFSINPNCPTKLIGGVVTSFEIFLLYNPGNVSFAYLNMSLSGPIPFQQGICYSLLPLPAPSHHGNLSATIPSGLACGWQIWLDVPYPAPDIPTGITMNANLTVSVS